MRFFTWSLWEPKTKVSNHCCIFCFECVLGETSIPHKRKNKLISLIAAISQGFIVSGHLICDTFSNTAGIWNIKRTRSILVQRKHTYLSSPAVFLEWPLLCHDPPFFLIWNSNSYLIPLSNKTYLLPSSLLSGDTKCSEIYLVFPMFNFCRLHLKIFDWLMLVDSI